MAGLLQPVIASDDDDYARRLEYSIVSSPLPVTDLRRYAARTIALLAVAASITGIRNGFALDDVHGALDRLESGAQFGKVAEQLVLMRGIALHRLDQIGDEVGAAARAVRSTGHTSGAFSLRGFLDQRQIPTRDLTWF